MSNQRKTKSEKSMMFVSFYQKTRDGVFILGPFKPVKSTMFSRQWNIYGYRHDDPTKEELACSHSFGSSAAAWAAINSYYERQDGTALLS